jgi:phosphatidylethanolamine N-methyltransferase
MPIHEDEYDGDKPIERSPADDFMPARDAGEVEFRGDQLPWSPGEYELRYHHDGKHNVMSRVGTLEIFGECS